MFSCPVIGFQYFLSFLLFLSYSYDIRLFFWNNSLRTEMHYVVQQHKMLRLDYSTFIYFKYLHLFGGVTCLFGSISDNLGNKFILCLLKSIL